MISNLRVPVSLLTMALILGLGACSPYKSANDAAVNAQAFDPNSITGTYQVRAVFKTGKAVQKVDANGVFNEPNGFVAVGNKMFEVVDANSIQTVYISPTTNLINQSAIESYKRSGNILTLTSATGTRQLAFTPGTNEITVVEQDGSYMIWVRVQDSVLKTAKSANHAEVFNFQYEITGPNEAKVSLPAPNPSASKIVKCERNSEGAVEMIWSETTNGNSANSLKFRLNGIADKDFNSEIKPQETTSTTVLVNIEHRADLPSLKLTTPFSSGPAGATCSEYHLSVTAGGHIHLQAKCGPLSATASDGKSKYTDIVSLEASCTVSAAAGH